MLDEKLFEYAEEIECSNEYAPARETRTWEETLRYIQETNLRIDKLIFKPKNTQLRFSFLPCSANEYITEVFNVNSPPVLFLRQFWDLGLRNIQSAMTKYMIQGYKNKYDGLNEEDKTWVTAAVLGGKDE